MRRTRLLSFHPHLATSPTSSLPQPSPSPPALSLMRRAGARSGLLALAPILALLSVVHADVNLSPATSSSSGQSGLSKTLSPSYIGMGIEPSNLGAYTGTSSPNPLSMQLLTNLADYTGIPPHIRVGGNTQDTAIYQSSYNGYGMGPNPSASGPADQSVFGPKFFQSINNLPKNTPVSLGIGMTYQGSDAVDMVVNIAREAVQSLTNVNLVGLEVGNEPDLYIQNQFRQSGWSIYDYGGEWIERVQAIYQQVLQPANIGTAFFEAACTATTAANPSYRIEELVKTGLASENGIYLAGWNQHDYYYYVGVSNYQLTLDILLDLSATSNQFNEWANQADSAAVTGKPYYIREMGSVGPAGLEGISNTFANALWTLNFFLYAATVGADSVQMHMLQSSYGAPWQPITDSDNEDTFVRPSYYGFAAMNQIIGAKCATTVAPISLSNAPGDYNGRLGAYAVYDDGKLQSLVLLNTKTAYSSQGSGIASQNFVIKLPDLAGQQFYVSTMTAAGADATANATWNGMSYEQTGNGSPTTVDDSSNSVQVGSDGTLTISVRDSQAVVANLGSKLGTQNNVVDQAACARLASTTSEGGATSTTTTGKGAAPTFKSTSGFASHLPLSMTAIIGIAAGGGAALLIVIGLCIWCCVRRSRKRRQMAADQAALLPPGKSRYANVPQRDSLDSSTANDDIWMMPMDGKRSRYDSASTADHKGNHLRTDSTPSLGGSPLMPSSNSMSDSRPRMDSAYGYRGHPNQPHTSSNLAHANAPPQRSNAPRGAAATQQPRRTPSAPNSRSAPGSRSVSPGRQAQSSQGHGARRTQRDNPAVPPLPPSHSHPASSSPAGPRRQLPSRVQVNQYGSPHYDYGPGRDAAYPTYDS